ncbi:heat shock protein 67b2 [Echinococcus multilocularis]|uniref:Heat shock protein 67b2 n=1 Tax=Echinococcus multilocularis TaxID=6211 RepID=A0A068YAB5_ECHMU|nr:heat shock protein 67b2 [Echinococcus multilocularis]
MAYKLGASIAISFFRKGYLPRPTSNFFNAMVYPRRQSLYRLFSGDVTFNPNINAKTFNTICKEPKGAQVFDVREPGELETDGRFPKAVNIPLGEVESAFALEEDEFKTKYGVPKPKVTDDNIIFVCRVGKRSFTACKSVEKYGYKKTLNLDGGYVAWKEQSEE